LFFGAAPELERIFQDVTLRAAERGQRHVVLRLKRVRHPDVVSLERFEHFLEQSAHHGLMVWLTGLQPDLLAAYDRLGFAEWLPRERVFPQGMDEDSSTLAAIRAVRSVLGGRQQREEGLYYLVQ
jgi:SulP family sulfate permease